MAFNWFKKKNKEIQIPESVMPEALEEEPAPEKPSDEEPVKPIEAMDVPETLKPVQKSSGFFQRLKNGLARTRKILTTNIDELFSGSRKFDENMMEELEELLITADIGVDITLRIIRNIAGDASKIITASDLKTRLKKELLELLPRESEQEKDDGAKPHVVMVIGVNGVGKTTTIGKIAAKSASEGKKVLIAAADTFRAAAVEQLGIWAQRAGAEMIRHKDNADPGAVAFDAVAAAMARDMDVVYVDTAGRLHTKTNLMEELKKIKRSISKKLPDAPHEILLVLDATTGQNALAQAAMFGEELGITGIVLTKLDGTAKGGIAVSICSTLRIPLKYVGVGESIDDLQDFDPVEFVDAML